MFQVQISRSVHLTVFITVLVTALGVEQCCAGSLVTTPPAIGGVLTSCGETRLTCSHDNVAGENTRWRITRMNSSMPVCEDTVTVNHLNPTPVPPYSCDVFSFINVTALPVADSYLNSTAMVNPLPLDRSGSQLERFAGSLSSSPSAGSITLCVIGECTYRSVYNMV